MKAKHYEKLKPKLRSNIISFNPVKGYTADTF